MEINDYKLKKNCTVYSGWANINKLKDFINNGFKPIKDKEGDIIQFYLSEKGVIYYKKERTTKLEIYFPF